MIEKELESEFKEPNPLNFKEIFEIIKSKTDEDLEYENLLTEEEKMEELQDKEDTKKFLLKSGCILAIIFTFIIVIGIIFVNENKSDLYKITEPLLKEYYKSEYNENISFKSIEKIVINNEETNIALATTKDNKHIMAINNKLIGDDISNNIKKELEVELNNKLSIANILSSEINLAYQDYYDKYNKKLDYINVIPNQKLEELKNSKKLTLEYTGFYRGDLDNELINDILKDYSSDSKFYLIKIDNGFPRTLNVINKNNQFNIDIIGQKEVDKGVYIYDMDRTYNAVNSVKFIRYSNSTIEFYPKYTLKNIFKIELDSNYSYNKDENIANYFMIKMDNLNKDNLLQVEYSESNRTYFEKDIEDYNNFIISTFGGNTYLIGEQEVTFGNLVENKSFLCNLGLC